MALSLEQQYIDVIMSALIKLISALTKMLEPTTPKTPIPRPRVFIFVSGQHGTISWPRDTGRGIRWDLVNVIRTTQYPVEWYMNLRSETSTLAECIVRACAGQPKKILRALRRIEAAVSWCKARRGGRQRAAQEILRQQEHANTLLMALCATQIMAREHASE